MENIFLNYAGSHFDNRSRGETYVFVVSGVPVSNTWRISLYCDLVATVEGCPTECPVTEGHNIILA